MSEPSIPDRNVVILVDNKIRDLDGAELIAHHLRRLGIQCHLEPLEAFRAVLETYRPAMIIFNLVTASHIASYTRRLHEMGVLTGVLLTEGIFYDPETLRFNVGRFHRNAHVDFYFCWNENYKKALLDEGFNPDSTAVSVGVHRFDFYFKPWSKLIQRPAAESSGRPKVLVCTNFFGGKYKGLPKKDLDKQFAIVAGRLPIYRNYERSVQAHWKGRDRFFDYLNELVDADKFEVTLRPHPLEGQDVYSDWFAALPPEKKRYVRYDNTSNISGLILDTDLEISCETCTTAIESWIAGKPTIELSFERDPLWCHEIHSRANVVCDDPKKLPALVEAQIANPTQPEVAAIRRQHIEDWCGNSDGNVCERIAGIIAGAIDAKRPADWSKLRFEDYRRAIKLRIYRALGQAYHFDMMLWIKYLLFPRSYWTRQATYDKSIKPSDVAAARRRIEAVKPEK